jgi:hypothetical protein
MTSRIRDFVVNNHKLILMTFEIFWILVFLLDRVIQANNIDIPQFIYVNF